MMSAAFAATALRCGTFLLVGILGLGWLSGYTANPTRRGPVSLWLGLPALGAIMLITAASILAGMTLSAASRAHGQVLSSMIGIVALVSTLWASSIAVQVAQNFFYRRVGAPPQPIRWIAIQTARRGRPTAGKR